MKSINLLNSACRYCRYYQPEGRRGGRCQMLEVPVQGSWKVCALAIPTFASAWQGLEEIVLPEEPLTLASSRPLVSVTSFSEPDSSEQAVGYAPEHRRAEPLLV